MGSAKVGVAYIRCSLAQQKLSPEAQRAAIEAYAAREGVSVVAWHVDRGVSGASAAETRPGLCSALAALREHRAGVLLVARRDRVARDAVIAGLVERAAAGAGAVLVSAAGEGSGSTPADGLIRGVIDSVSAYERLVLKARTKAALAAKAARGERVSRHPPYGFAIGACGVMLVPSDAEQAIIRRAAEHRAAGLSLRGVSASLALEGLRNRAGRDFDPNAIANMLARRAG